MRVTSSALRSVHMVSFGIGTNGWRAHRKQLKLPGVDWAVTPWPSELEGLDFPATQGVINSTKTDMIRVCAFSRHRIRSDAVVLNKTNGVISPSSVAPDCHPVYRKRKIAEQCCHWLFHERATWRWLINSTMYGDPQSREREAAIIPNVGNAQQELARLFIYDVLLPSVVSEFAPTDPASRIIPGHRTIQPRNSRDPLQPIPLALIKLPIDHLVYGT